MVRHVDVTDYDYYGGDYDAKNTLIEVVMTQMILAMKSIMILRNTKNTTNMHCDPTLSPNVMKWSK